MKLRNKVLIGLSLVWLIFLGLTYAGSKFFLLRSFLELEQDRANRDLSRADQALDQIAYSLYTLTSDWAHWNDLYDFMQGKNPAFVPNNLNMTAFLNSTINLISYWDKLGNLTVGASIDTDNGKLTSYPAGLDQYLYPKSLLLDRPDVTKDARGYILLPSGIMMVAASALTEGDKTLPPLGAAVFGRFLSTKILRKIEETTKLDLKLIIPSQLTNNAQLKSYFDDITTNKTGHLAVPINEHTLQGYSLIKDIYGKPIGMFQMTTPRAIYKTGVEAIKYYLLSFTALGVIFSGLMLWLLRALIIKRLERLDYDVEEISSKNELSRRVDATGSDELSSV